MISTELAFIHSNKTAKYNYKYLDKDGTVYIGQKDGRLKRQELAINDIQSLINTTRTSTQSSTISSGISTETDVSFNPFLLMGG